MRGLVLTLVVVTACHEPRPCAMPGDHETRPAMKVDLPPVALAGFTLGSDAAALAKTCADRGGTVGGASSPVFFCSAPGASVQVRLDAWGRAIEVQLDDATLTRADAGAAIDRALGGDGTYVGESSWPWRGGVVYLNDAPLTLRYERDDMRERTVYGLPNCGVS